MIVVICVCDSPSLIINVLVNKSFSSNWLLKNSTWLYNDAKRAPLKSLSVSMVLLNSFVFLISILLISISIHNSVLVFISLLFQLASMYVIKSSVNPVTKFSFFFSRLACKRKRETSCTGLLFLTKIAYSHFE